MHIFELLDYLDSDLKRKKANPPNFHVGRNCNVQAEVSDLAATKRFLSLAQQWGTDLLKMWYCRQQFSSWMLQEMFLTWRQRLMQPAGPKTWVFRPWSCLLFPPALSSRHCPPPPMQVWLSDGSDCGCRTKILFDSPSGERIKNP